MVIKQETQKEKVCAAYPNVIKIKEFESNQTTEITITRTTDEVLIAHIFRDGDEIKSIVNDEYYLK